MASKRSYAQELCVKKAGLVLHVTSAIWPHCRIGVAVSGGVDSFVLLKALRLRQRILPFPVELLAIHLNPGFDLRSHQDLAGWLSAEGIASHIEVTNFGPRAHSPENKKGSPCFYCAWLRRKRLFDLCRQYKLSHLALGHNAEDLASTFMMNIFKNGNVRGMSAKEGFFDGKLHLIRPLLLVEKKYIRQAARQWGLPYWENSCPSSGKTLRTDMNSILQSVNDLVPGAKRSLFNALSRWQLANNTPINNS